MKINERIVTGYRTETRTRFVPAQYDEDGVQLAAERMETYTVDIPETAEVVREMTAEEVAAMEADAVEVESVPSAEERISELEAANAMLLECVLEMSEIIYA